MEFDMTTKTTFALLAAGLMLALPGAGFAQDRGAQAERGERHAHARGGHEGGDRAAARGMTRLTGLLELYDTDGDGALTQDEIAAARNAQLSQFDADGNGSLSLQEYQGLWLDAMRDRMVDRFQSHDDDGDGQVTAQEFADAQARRIARMDRNEDGVINRDDFRRGSRGEARPAE